jgi:hypothetical protein
MSFITSVNKLLRRNGTTSYSLKKVSTPSFDITNPTQAPTTTTTTYSLLAFPGQYKDNQIDGELVRMDDIKFYVDPTNLSVSINTADKIINDDEEWDIIRKKTYTQGDTVVLYILQLRN